MENGNFFWRTQRVFHTFVVEIFFWVLCTFVLVFASNLCVVDSRLFHFPPVVGCGSVSLVVGADTGRGVLPVGASLATCL